jgi:hypothetical protein
MGRAPGRSACFARSGSGPVVAGRASRIRATAFRRRSLRAAATAQPARPPTAGFGAAGFRPATGDPASRRTTPVVGRAGGVAVVGCRSCAGGAVGSCAAALCTAGASDLGVDAPARAAVCPATTASSSAEFHERAFGRTARSGADRDTAVRLCPSGRTPSATLVLRHTAGSSAAGVTAAGPGRRDSVPAIRVHTERSSPDYRSSDCGSPSDGRIWRGGPWT